MSTLTPSSDSEVGTHDIKLAYFGNEFPHDDLPYLTRQLHIHSKDGRRHNLARFISAATLVLREEIRELPASLKILLPPFATILDLADYPELRSGPLSGSIDGVLLCVVELAIFIG
jgi:hypothetical protein